MTSKPRPRIAAVLPLLSLAAALAQPAAAAGPFVPPAGCRLEMTVQLHGCSVSQHYRCEADAPGDQWAEYLGEAGTQHLSRIDRETRWMESSNPQAGIHDRLEPEAADHASLDTLLASGRDDFDFWTVDDDGQRLHHVGYDELTGETVTIDGIALQRTRFALETTDADGQLVMRRSGSQFVSAAQRRFYGGRERAEDWTGTVVETDDSPVEFALPGAPGFGALRPRYDCERPVASVGRTAG